MLCLGRGVPEPSLMMAGKDANKARTAGHKLSSEDNKTLVAVEISCIGCRLLAHNPHFLNGSTNNLLVARKSTPRIGLATAASINNTINEDAPKKTSFLVTLPQEAMLLPSVATRAGPEGGVGERWGRTLTAAPVSTRKDWLVVSSLRKTKPPSELSSLFGQSGCGMVCWISVATWSSV